MFNNLFKTMHFRQAIFDDKQPKLSEDEHSKFTHALARLDDAGCVLFDGKVCSPDDDKYVHGIAYLNKWSWSIWNAVNVMRGRINAEPDFVAFTFEMVEKLGLLENKK